MKASKKSAKTNKGNVSKLGKVKLSDLTPKKEPKGGRTATVGVPIKSYTV